MSHFSKVINGIVVDVNVAEQEWVNQQHDKELWIQTSYNSRGGIHYLPDSDIPSGKQHLRYNYAGIGYTYDEIRDAFIPPKPYDSWVLNEETCLWESPIPYPLDDKEYYWNEEVLDWVEYNELELELGE